MDIKHIRYFLQVCEDESFTKASKNLYITQQGLSKAIKNLEEYVHVPLFYRTVNGVKLTEHGKYLREKSLYILEQYDSYLDDISKMSNLEPQKLKVCFSLSVLNALSTDLIPSFRQTYPQIELNMSELPDSYCEKVVFERIENIDIAVTVGPIDESRFNSKVIKTYHPCVLINKKHPLSQQNEINFEDLKNQKIIIPNKSFKLHHNFVDKCKQSGFEPDIAYTATEMYIVHKLTRLNKGIGISLDFIADDINYPNVCSRPFADKSFVWEINLIYRKDFHLPSAGRIFADYIMNY